MKSRFSKRRIEAEKLTREGLGNGMRVFCRRRNWWRKVGRLLALPNGAANRHVSKFPSFMMVMTEAYILNLPKYIVKKYIGGNTRDIDTVII